MAIDALDALVAYWAADATLTGLGLTPLHSDSAPGSSYPYAVIGSLGAKVKHRNFGKGTVLDSHYRINVYSPVKDTAATLGAAVVTSLDVLVETPLVFTGGIGINVMQTGEDLIKIPGRGGTSGVPFVWVWSGTYRAMTSRTRA